MEGEVPWGPCIGGPLEAECWEGRGIRGRKLGKKDVEFELGVRSERNAGGDSMEGRGCPDVHGQGDARVGEKENVPRSRARVD